MKEGKFILLVGLVISLFYLSLMFIGFCTVVNEVNKYSKKRNNQSQVIIIAPDSTSKDLNAIVNIFDSYSQLHKEEFDSLCKINKVYFLDSYGNLLGK